MTIHVNEYENKTVFSEYAVSSDRIIYTPSSFARENLLHLQETGTLKALKPHTSKRTELVSYLFFIVQSGSGQLQYQNQEYLLKKDDCVFIDCRQNYSHKTTNGDLWSLSWVHFYGPNMPEIYDKYVRRGGGPVFQPGTKLNTYKKLLEEIHIVAASKDYVRDMKINEKISSLLTLLMESSWGAENDNNMLKRQQLEEIRAYLDEHFKDQVSLEQLEKMFFINKYYLTRIFKEQFGTTINSYVMEKRVTAAKELLRFTDEKIEQVALSCGIADANYFSRMFRKVEGITPGAFRKMWHK